MKKNMKRLALFVKILTMSINITTYGKSNVNRKNDVQNKKTEQRFEKGMNVQFTTDGKLHEEKFLNKVFMYTDTDDSFKISKDKSGYSLTRYNYNPEDGTETEEKGTLKLHNNVYLIDENGLVYAYDTKLKKVVFLNQDNNFRIMMIAEEE